MIVLAFLIFLVLTGAPLFIIVGGLTLLCLHQYTDLSQWQDLKLVIQQIENLATKQEFLAVPLFMISGAVMTAGGMARRLVHFMEAALCWVPGGLAIAAVAACMFFASVSGSSPVTLIAVGSMMVPAMIKANYEENFSIGLVTTAGSLGCLVPPSLSMLIYAISVSGSQSVDPSDLFLAGLIPATFIGLLLMGYSMFKASRMPVERPSFSFDRLKTAFKDSQFALLLPVIVLGGIYGGLFTPSQAGASAVFYAVLVTVFIERELTFKKLLESLSESALLLGTLLPIIVLTFGLNDFLALMNVQEQLKDLLASWDLGPAGFMLVSNFILIILGALMDSISATLIFAPILAPIATGVYGFDPIHFAMVFIVNMELGYLVPPIATNLFVASSVFKKPFGQVVRATFPTLNITIFALLVFIFIPTLSVLPLRLRADLPAWLPFPVKGEVHNAPQKKNLKDLFKKSVE